MKVAHVIYDKSKTMQSTIKTVHDHTGPNMTIQDKTCPYRITHDHTGQDMTNLWLNL